MRGTASNEREVFIGARVPSDLIGTKEATTPTFEQTATTWRAARVDVAASTAEQHRIHIEKLVPVIGTMRIDTLEPVTFINVVAKLHEQSLRTRHGIGRSSCRARRPRRSTRHRRPTLRRST